VRNETEHRTLKVEADDWPDALEWIEEAIARYPGHEVHELTLHRRRRTASAEVSSWLDVTLELERPPVSQ